MLSALYPRATPPIKPNLSAACHQPDVQPVTSLTVSLSPA
jgi:hypothetical protein